MDLSRPDIARREYRNFFLASLEHRWNARYLTGALDDLRAVDAKIAERLQVELNAVHAETANHLRCFYMNLGACMAAMRELRNSAIDVNASKNVEMPDSPQAQRVMVTARTACRRLLDREAMLILEKVNRHL